MALLDVKKDVGRIAKTAIAQIIPIAPQMVRCCMKKKKYCHGMMAFGWETGKRDVVTVFGAQSSWVGGGSLDQKWLIGKCYPCIIQAMINFV